ASAGPWLTRTTTSRPPVRSCRRWTSRPRTRRPGACRDSTAPDIGRTCVASMSGAEGGPAIAVPALRLGHLSKTFLGTRALVDVDLTVNVGEIHALVGGNGSGKSTLIKILAGVYQADPGGTIEVAGGGEVPADHWNPNRAFAAGMRFVHQNPGVFNDL